jgi:hypothetical protein
LALHHSKRRLRLAQETGSVFDDLVPSRRIESVGLAKIKFTSSSAAAMSAPFWREMKYALPSLLGVNAIVNFFPSHEPDKPLVVEGVATD